MSHFQNKNKVWINNTLKSANEVAKVLEILKDIGVFREKPKKRKPKQPKEEDMPEDDDEFLVPPSGGGGPSGASVGLLPTSSITQALQALKSGASSQAQQQNLLERAKEDLQLQYGRMLDLSQQQNRFADLRPSQPTIEDITPPDWLEEETGTNFFPQKEAVVSEAPQEFQEERSGTDIPEEVMNIDVSQKVSPEEGVIEEEEQTAFAEAPAELSISEKFKILADQYGLRSISKKAQRDDLQNYLRNLYIKFNKKAPATAISRMRKDELQKEIQKLILTQYAEIYD